jgi:23S rRNA G2445 N2-methylase RlmL
MGQVELIATTAFGLEAIVAHELKQLGYQELQVENTSYRAGIEATNSALKRGEDLNNLYTRGVLKTYLVTAYKIIARNIKQFSRMALGKLRKPKRPKAGILCPNLG